MPKWGPATDWGLWALSDPRLSNPSQDMKEALLWSRRTWVNVAVRPCLHSFLTRNKHLPFENKVWEIYIFIKKCIRSLLKSSLSVDYVPVYICIRVVYNTTIATTPKSKEGCYSFPWSLHFTLDAYLIILSVKQGGIKYHFWVFGMTRPKIEPRSPGPLANTLLIRPMAQFIDI